MAETTTKSLPPKELAAFFESVSMLLQAGVPANECPGIIASDMEKGPMANAARALEAQLDSGEVFTLSDAMDRTGGFPKYAVDMLRLSEESGRMESTAISLGSYYRRQDQLNQNIRNAIGGPLLLLVIMGVVLIFLMVFVLPVFENVFTSLGMATGGGVGGAFLAARIAMGVVGALLLIVLLVAVAYMLPGGNSRIGRWAEVFPLTKDIHYAISASRLANAMEMLMASGIPVDEALDKASILVSNNRISSRLPICRDEVAKGEDLAKSLVDTGVLVGFEAKVLLSASRAGQTETAMQKLSALYAEEADGGIDRLLGMIEPALVGILSVAIGVILLSVMLPLTSIMSAIN